MLSTYEALERHLSEKISHQTIQINTIPFPHFVIDDFLPVDIFKQINSSSPSGISLRKEFFTPVEKNKQTWGDEELSGSLLFPVKLLGGAIGKKLVSKLISSQSVKSMMDMDNYGGYYSIGDGYDDIYNYCGSAPDMGAHEYNSLSTGNLIEILPIKYLLENPYPNPFNPVTNIKYSIPENTDVSIRIYGINGNMIEELYNGNQVVGTYNLSWDADNQPSGLYFVKMTANSFTQTQKLMLVK